MSAIHNKLHNGNNYNHWKPKLFFFFYTNPNLTHWPKHQTLALIISFLSVFDVCARDERTENFSVRVQSCSEKFESDPVLILKIFENHQPNPVLIRPCEIMCFILPHKTKVLQQLFCL